MVEPDATSKSTSGDVDDPIDDGEAEGVSFPDVDDDRLYGFAPAVGDRHPYEAIAHW